MVKHGLSQSHKRVCPICGAAYIQGPGQVACSSRCAKTFRAKARITKVDAIRAVADLVRGERDQRTIFDDLAEREAAKLGVMRGSEVRA